jgi:hypothetical protein
VYTTEYTIEIAKKTQYDSIDANCHTTIAPTI